MGVNVGAAAVAGCAVARAADYGSDGERARSNLSVVQCVGGACSRRSSMAI